MTIKDIDLRFVERNAYFENRDEMGIKLKRTVRVLQWRKHEHLGPDYLRPQDQFDWAWTDWQDVPLGNEDSQLKEQS